jgi:hypothetical protein
MEQSDTGKGQLYTLVMEQSDTGSSSGTLAMEQPDTGKGQLRHASHGAVQYR